MSSFTKKNISQTKRTTKSNNFDNIKKPSSEQLAKLEQTLIFTLEEILEHQSAPTLSPVIEPTPEPQQPKQPRQKFQPAPLSNADLELDFEIDLEMDKIQDLCKPPNSNDLAMWNAENTPFGRRKLSQFDILLSSIPDQECIYRNRALQQTRAVWRHYTGTYFVNTKLAERNGWVFSSSLEIPVSNPFELLSSGPPSADPLHLHENDTTPKEVYKGNRPCTMRAYNKYVRNSRMATEEEKPCASLRLRGCNHGNIPETNACWWVGPDGHVYMPTQYDRNFTACTLRELSHGHDSNSIDEHCRDQMYRSDHIDNIPWWSIYTGSLNPNNWRNRNRSAPKATPKLSEFEVDWEKIFSLDLSEAELIQACINANTTIISDIRKALSWQTPSALTKREFTWRSLHQMICSVGNCRRDILCSSCNTCFRHCTHLRRPNIPRRRHMPRKLIKEILLQQAFFEQPKSKPSSKDDWPAKYATFDDDEPTAQAQFNFFGVPDKFNHVIEIPIIKEFIDFLQTTKGDVAWSTILKECIFAFVHARNSNWSPMGCLAAITHLFSNIGLPSAIAASLMELWNRHAPSCTESESAPAQSACFDVLGMLPVVGSMITVMLTFFLVGKLPGGRETDALISRASSIGRLVTSWEKVDQYFRPMMENFTDFIRQCVFGISKRELDGWKRVDDWCDEVQALRTTDYEQRVRDDIRVVQKVNSLNDTGIEILKQFDALRIAPAARSRVQLMMQFLAQARTIASASTAGGSRARIAPTVIHFFGDSGVGKSTMLGFLNADLCAALGCTDPADVSNKVYYRRALTDNWDGYRNGTLIVVCDDFGSVKDCLNNPNPQLYEQINIANTAHFPLPMAHLSEKGQTNMEARAVIWTTNRSQFKFDSLTNPEAVLNRVTLKFEMFVIPEYVESRMVGENQIKCLNWKKLAVELETDKFAALKAMRFYRIDPMSQKDDVEYDADGNKREYTYRQMADLCIEELLKRGDAGKNMLSTFEDYFRVLTDPENTARAAQINLDKVRLVKEGSGYIAQHWVEHTTPEAPLEPEMHTIATDYEIGSEPPTVTTDLGVHQGTEFYPSLTFAMMSGSPPAEPIHGALAWHSRPGLITRLYDAVGSSVASLFKGDNYRYPYSLVHLDHFWSAMNMQKFGLERADEVDFIQGNSATKTLLDMLLARKNLDVKKIATSSCVTVRACDALNFSVQFHTFLQSCIAQKIKIGSTAATQIARELIKVEFQQCYCAEHQRAGYINDYFQHAMGENSGAAPDEVVTLIKSAYWVSFERLVGSFFKWFAIIEIGKLLKNWLFPPAPKASPAEGLSKEAMELKCCVECTERPKWFNDHWGRPISSHNGRPLWSPEKIEAIHRQHPHRFCDLGCECGDNDRVFQYCKKHFPFINHSHIVEAYNHTPRSAAPAKHEAYSSIPASAFPAKHEAAKSESTNDANSDDIINKIFKNCYALFSRDSPDEEWVIHGTATAISGRVFITNAHIWNLAREHICIGTANGVKHYTFTKSECNSSLASDTSALQADHDVAIFEAPRTVPLHGSLLNHFADPEMYATHKSVTRVSLAGYNKSGFAIIRSSDLCIAGDKPVPVEIPGRANVMVRKTYQYGIDTAVGDCGSLLVARDPAFQKKILGIHCAGGLPGSPYTGTTSAVHSKFLGDLLKNLTCKFPESIQDSSILIHSPAQAKIQSNGEVIFDSPVADGFTYLGRDKETIFSNDRTQIRPSPAHGLVQAPTTCPAHLRKFSTPEGVVDPRKLAMAKAATPSVGCNNDFLAMAVNDYKQNLFRHRVESDQREISRTEAIQGVIGDPLFPGINRNAGAGYGWRKSGKGKTTWLGADDWIVDDPAVMARLDELDSLLSNGKRLGFIWIDALKDERRPIAKVNQGKTRLYSQGEMGATIWTRQVMMGFCAHLMRRPLEYESCVGINAYGLDWHHLALRLKLNSDNVVAGDFTNYDGSLSAPILWAVCDIVKDFYRNKRDAAVQALFLELINSIHISGNILYQWTHSQPSGCAITTILNCVYHSLAMRVAFLEAASKYSPGHCNMDSYNKFVTHFNYGDDDVSSIHDDIIGWFNQHSMTEAYKTFGMTYTDETKSGEPVKFRKLEEVRFLKRGFVFDKLQSRWRAPLDPETILEMTNWVHGNDVMLLLSLELKSAIYEAAQYPEDQYKEFLLRFKSVQSLLERTYPVYFPTYLEAQYLDAERYCGIGAYNQSSKLRDRGTLSSAESECAANPAEVSSFLPSPARTEARAELFSSIDTCVALSSDKNRLCILPTDLSYGCKTDLQKAPAQSNTESTDFSASFSGTQSTTTRQETAVFHEDGDVVSGSAPSTSLIPSIRNPVHDSLKNEISGILGRPVQFNSFIWTTADARGVTLCEIDIPADFLKVPVHKAKLAGFRYLSFDLTLEVQINNQPFNAGGLIAYFVPLLTKEEAINGVFLQKLVPSGQYLPGITGYPSVVWKCGQETALKITVPFIPITQAYDLKTGYGTCGKLRVAVYSPLTGTGDVDGVSWVWATNVKFDMPSGLTAIAQANEAEVPQVKEEKATPGPVARIASALSTVATGAAAIAALAAPPIAPFVAAGAAVLGAAGKIASLFGWSRPNDTTTPQLVHQSTFRHMANANGDSKAKSLALISDNATNIPTNVFGTGEDEMAFSTLLKRPTLLDIFKWTKEKQNGALLWKWPVDPTSCVKSQPEDVDGKRVCQHHNSYLSYVTNLAQFYRGGITYHFNLFKTPFHSGRFTIYWLPGFTESNDLKDIDRNLLYKQVYDLRQTNDFEFTIPFVHAAPWKPLHEEQLRYASEIALRCYNVPTGLLLVEVTNALRAPTTAADEFEIIVSVSAAEDFQLAFPYLDPHARLCLDGSLVTAPRFTGVAKAQANFFPAPSPSALQVNGDTIGEAYLSLRQLLKRFLTHAPAGVSQDRPYVDLPVCPKSEKDIKKFEILAQQSLRMWTGMLYRFKSGSLKTLYFTEPSKDESIVSITPGFGGEATPLSPLVVSSTHTEPIIEFLLPFYQPWSALPTEVGYPRESFETQISSPGHYTSMPYNQGTIFHDLTVPNKSRTLSCIGEDFSYGYLLGPPVTWHVFDPMPEMMSTTSG